MKAKHTDLEKLEQLYKESGNQLVVLYGRRGCQKEELIKEFCDGKKFFYYRCRQASPEHQLEMMGASISLSSGITRNSWILLGMSSILPPSFFASELSTPG